MIEPFLLNDFGIELKQISEQLTELVLPLLGMAVDPSVASSKTLVNHTKQILEQNHAIALESFETKTPTEQIPWSMNE